MVIRRIHKSKRPIRILRNGRFKKVDVECFPRRGCRSTPVNLPQASTTSRKPSATGSGSAGSSEKNVGRAVPSVSTGGAEEMPGTDTCYSKRKKENEEEWQSLLGVLQDAELYKNNVRQDLCSDCGTNNVTLYRCISCTIWKAVCHECLERNHSQPHLHRFEVWKGGTYLPYTTTTPILSTGHTCDTAYQKTLFVLDDAGIQVERIFHLCDCEREAITLLRLGFWPSSPKFPRMAFHLSLMALISKLMLECHVSLKSIAEVIKQRNQANQQHCDVYNVMNRGMFFQFKNFESKMTSITETNNNCADSEEDEVVDAGCDEDEDSEEDELSEDEVVDEDDDHDSEDDSS